jgi:phenylacetate-CoA ligase
VCKVPASTCSCGRTYDIYEGGILGRVDDMKLVRGTNVYPRAIEAIVREFPSVDEFQTVITREGIRDEITLRVELKPGTEAEWTGSRRRCTASSRKRTRGSTSGSSWPARASSRGSS